MASTKQRATVTLGPTEMVDSVLLEDAAFDKLVHDLTDHGAYFEGRWLLTGVAEDCRQAAKHLRNMRNLIRWLLPNMEALSTAGARWCAAYDAYQARGALPAPDEYREWIEAGAALREALPQ